MSYDVFLSYSSQDRDWVEKFSASLRDSGVTAWVGASDIAPGERWQDRIQEALRESRTLVVILSPESMRSPLTFFELGAALADQKRIIPIMTEDGQLEQMPPFLRSFQVLRENSPVAAGKRVAQVIESGSAGSAPGSTHPQTAC